MNDDDRSKPTAVALKVTITAYAVALVAVITALVLRHTGGNPTHVFSAYAVGAAAFFTVIVLRYTGRSE